MVRFDFLGFVLLLSDISRLDRYSTRQFYEPLSSTPAEIIAEVQLLVCILVKVRNGSKIITEYGSTSYYELFG